MRHSFRLLLVCCFFIVSPSVLAAAFQLYELGSPIVGTADVGQAVTEDASSSYFNPATMTQLPQSEFMIGSEILLPYTNFSKNPHRTTITGDNGGNAGVLSPVGGFFYVYSLFPQLKLGVNLTSPYAGYLYYEDGWVGRYIVQDLQFYAMALNPAVGYKVNNWLALGAGLTIEYANLHQTVALPITKLLDGQANLKMDNTSVGFNVGALFTPTPSTQLGITYRSHIIHDFRGNTTFFHLGFTPSTNTKMTMPQNVIISVSQILNPHITLLGEAGWAAWSSMRNNVVSIAGFTVSTPENWHDTYRLGIGGQFTVNQALILQAGASFDSSPTGAGRRTPNLPMDRQIRLGFGLKYALIQPVQLGVSYEYLNLGNANIDNMSSTGKFGGAYSRNYTNVFQASLNVDC